MSDIRRVNIPDTSLLRDVHSRGLIETDRKKAEDYLVKSKMMARSKNFEEEINTLKKDMQEIKDLLKGLVNK